MARNSLRQAWLHMRWRCSDRATGHHRRRYFSRGIRVCDRWESFEAFMQDMGPRPTPKHSIERIDNNGDYSPDNCCWASKADQMLNRSTTRRFVYQGETFSINKAAKRVGIGFAAMKARIERYGVDVAMSFPKCKKGEQIRLKAIRLKKSGRRYEE